MAFLNLSDEVKDVYEVKERRFLPDLDCEGLLLSHKKTGARVVLIPNDENNKVFYIAFRTPPENSTGVAHIIEHTVLCGSKDFNVKDPFIELVKGSLNTFLNAMTYPDKTVYPVASCNEKDFKNLMHVYLDAVFYPNIYKEENIFRQEGWHYEAEDEDSEITVNGVVYNEMKGALSSPDDVLSREIFRTLYPDTPYRHESGGDPQHIPDLTYEYYLHFHRRYYHPSNSYIYLYGDMDMNERLLYMDREYLGHFDRLDIDSSIPEQQPFTEPREYHTTYSVMQDEDIKGKTYLAWNVNLGPDNLDPKFMTAFKILDYVLSDAEGAPVRKALRTKGIGEDVYSIFETGIRQPGYSVVSKYTDPDKKEEFLSTIRTTLEGLVRDGIDKRALAAGINYFEFRYREANSGSYPKGLLLGLSALDSWLYDDEKPWINIDVGRFFDELKVDAQSGYFEKLISEHLLDNPHSTVLVMEPEPGLSERRDRMLKEKLDKMARDMGPAHKKEIVERTRALRKWQETPDREEDIRAIPMLKREDLGKKALDYANKVTAVGDITFLQHPVFTNKISYLTFIFDLKKLPERYLKYLGIFRAVFGVLDTNHFGYADFNNEINIKTGGISPSISAYSRNKEQDFRFTFEISAKVLTANVKDAFDLVKEIVLETRYDTPARIREVLEEERSGMRADLASSGHATAALRAKSYYSKGAKFVDMTSGIGQYRTLTAVCEKLADPHESVEEAEKLSQILSEIAKAVFRKENLMVDCTARGEDMEEMEELITDFADSLYTEPVGGGPFELVPERMNEGFSTAGQVQYVCRSGRFLDEAHPYTGCLSVLRVILGYNYLWNRIRVKGGAYGCMNQFSRDGSGYFVSYRDPHLKQTIETFEQAADFVRSFDADERTMTQYIIGAISGIDTPLSPSGYGRYSLAGYMTGTTYEQIQRERDQILGTQKEDIRALGDYIDRIMSGHYLCVVGSESSIKKHEDLFMKTEKLV